MPPESRAFDDDCRARAKVLAEKQSELMKAMPLLDALYNAEGAKPQVRYLEGAEGVKTVRALFEKLSGDSIEIVPFDDVQETKELMGREREEHHAALRNRGIKYRIWP